MSQLHLIDVQRAELNEQQWSQYVMQHPEASPYHTVAWADAMQAGFGYRCHFISVLESNGNDVVGVLPLFVVRGLRRCRLVATPFRDRGGPLWDNEQVLALLINHVRRLAAHYRAGYCELKPGRTLPAEVLSEHQLVEHSYWLNSQISLRDLTSSSYLQKLNDKTRNMVRRAERNDLNWVRYDSLRALKNFYRIYLQSQRALGLPALPARFFETLFERYRTDSCRLWLSAVERHGELGACALIVEFNNTALYAYSASNHTGKTTRANDLMLFRSIVDCAERGLETFDMGSDSPSQEGLLFFKRKWGAKQTPLPYYYPAELQAAAQLDSTNQGYQLMRRIIRHLPLSVNRTLGSFACRYFG